MVDRASLDDLAATTRAAGERPSGLRTEDFDYLLDERRIAQHPLSARDASRLLVVRRIDSSIEDRVFKSLPELMKPGDVLVLNETRVFPARLLGHKPTGAAAEVLLVDRIDGEGFVWRALVRPGGKLKPGRLVHIGEDLDLEIQDSTADGARIVRLITPMPPFDAISRYGHVPLPPYIRREDDEADRTRYQTVYARERGSVAAPTAGLHFTEDLLGAVRSRGIEVARLTLHVGPGTFRPVEASDPAEHYLGTERYRIEPVAADVINRAREGGGAVWAVGTTTVRALETVVGADGLIAPGEGATDLFVRPGYEFRAADRIVTNFHLPRSTLLMLVAAFAGYELTMSAYKHAVQEGYRFYSYGDAMVVT